MSKKMCKAKKEKTVTEMVYVCKTCGQYSAKKKKLCKPKTPKLS
jgi:hypothetical protein